MTDDFRKSKADYIIQQLNVQTAKKVCFLLALSFIIYHSYIHYRYGKIGESRVIAYQKSLS